MQTRHAAALVLASILPLGAAVAARAETVETVHLAITGGPNAGTWDATGDRAGCSYGFAGPGSWGNQLSNPKDKDPKKFNSLQLIVPDAKKAAGGTKEFYLTVGFGPLLQRSAEYKVDTRATEPKKTGSGTVTVTDHGATGKVTFDVATAEGIKLQGTIDCLTVARNGN